MRSTPIRSASAREVLLEVRRDPDVAAQRVERVLGEHPRRLVGLLAQVLDQHVQPVGAVLDAGDPQRRGGAVNTPWTTSEAIVSWIARSDGERRWPSGSLLPNPNVASAAPRRGEPALVAAVAEVERDGDRRPRRGGPRPGRAACRRATGSCRSGRAPAPDGRARCAPRARAASRPRRRRASGSASDSIGAAMSRPSWSKPQSSSSQRLNAERLAIVAGMSSRSASSTPQPSVGNSSAASRPCSSMTVDARGRGPVLGAQRLDLHQRAGVDALGDLAPEQRVEAARHDDRVEGRVRDEAVDLAADQQLARACRPAPGGRRGRGTSGRGAG